MLANVTYLISFETINHYHKVNKIRVSDFEDPTVCVDQKINPQKTKSDV